MSFAELNMRSASSREDAFEQALQMLAEMQDQVERLYLVVADHDVAVQLKKRLAKQKFLLGVDVTTLPYLVQDLWELWGNGHSLVSAAQRSLLVRKALRTHLSSNPESNLVMTDGVAELLSRTIKEGLPALAEELSGLNDAEYEITAVARMYSQNLSENGLVEPSSAIALLGEVGALEGAGVVVLDAETTVLEDAFFQSAARVDHIQVSGFSEVSSQRNRELNDVQSMLFAATGDHPASPEGAVRFALPAGPNATAELIAQEVCQLLRANDTRVIRSEQLTHAKIAVASCDPLNLFDRLAGRISQAELQVNASIAFDETDFGRAWCSLLAFLEEGDYPDTFLATDFALSSFSGMSVQGAFACDARWRGWRGQTVDEAITDMAGFAGDGFDQIVALIGEGELLDALSHYRAIIHKQLGRSEAYRAQQLQAVSLAETVYEDVYALGGSSQDYLNILRNTHIKVSQMLRANDPVGQFPGDSVPNITVMNHVELAKYSTAAFDAVVLCDLEASAFPLREGNDAKDELFKKLGLYKQCDTTQELRTLFARCFGAAQERVVVSRTLSTVDGEENLPVFMLEELVDCYRTDLRNAEELDKIFGVPKSLIPFVTTLGDEKIGRNISSNGQAEPLEIEVPIYSAGHLEDSFLNTADIVLSPSAIEAYLECPYGWFVGRRIKSQPLDAGFGVLEFGSFAHLVMERFYSRLQALGMPRVQADNLTEAQAILEEVFDRALEEQPDLPPQEALIIPHTELEFAEVAGLKRDLLSLVKREVRFLPAYHPAQHEVVFGGEEPCDYAGMKVAGRIDRYDIDGLGNAVIIDYKGSINKDYAYGGQAAEERELPRKVQGLIYAQILRRQTGLTPQGILYRSYKKPGLFGTFDHRFLDARKDLENINDELCAVVDLGAVLDQVEEMIASRLEDFKRGMIDAFPVDDKACMYCALNDVHCSARDQLFGGA